VEPEPRLTDRRAGGLPRFLSARRPLVEGAALSINEHARLVLPDLPTDHIDGFPRQGHTDRTACLGLIGVNPRASVRKVDLGPLEAKHVALSQAGPEREARDGA